MPEEIVQSTASAVGDQSANVQQQVIDKYYKPADLTVQSTSTQAQPDPIAVLQAQVAALTNQLKEAVTPPIQRNQQQQPAEGAWLQLLSEGKRKEGEAALAAVLGPRIQEQAVQQALSLMQAESHVSAYVGEVRAANPDLADMEPYIAAAAQQRISQAQASGRIQSPADYVTVYKEAVNAEIEKARQTVLKLRGAGAQQVTNRVAEVRGQTFLQPNAVNSNRDVQSNQQDQMPDMNTLNTDYFAKRQQQYQRNTGMSVN